MTASEPRRCPKCGGEMGWIEDEGQERIHWCKCGYRSKTNREYMREQNEKLKKMFHKCGHEEKVDHNDPPLGSFPDDYPCPKCNTRLILHSHGYIAGECPNCHYCIPVEGHEEKVR